MALILKSSLQKRADAGTFAVGKDERKRGGEVRVDGVSAAPGSGLSVRDNNFFGTGLIGLGLSGTKWVNSTQEARLHVQPLADCDGSRDVAPAVRRKGWFNMFHIFCLFPFSFPKSARICLPVISQWPSSTEPKTGSPCPGSLWTHPFCSKRQKPLLTSIQILLHVWVTDNLKVDFWVYMYPCK